MKRVGLFGCGAMGRHHARVLQNLPSVELVGVFDKDFSMLHAGFSGQRCTTALELVESQLDYAVVALPTRLHFEVCFLLAEAQVPFLVEKPLARTVDEAQRLRQLVEKYELVAGVGHIERFNAAMQEARRRIEAGQLGRIYQISTQRTGPFPPRIDDIGVIGDLASHDIDAVRFLTGSDYVSVDSRVFSQAGRKHEDAVIGVAELSSGIVVNHVVNWLSPRKTRMVTVLGERGALEIDTLRSSLTFAENGLVDDLWDAVALFQGVSEGDVTQYAFAKHEPLVEEHRSFLRAVTEGHGDIVTLDDGIEVLRVVDMLLHGGSTSAFNNKGIGLVPRQPTSRSASSSEEQAAKA